jgi:hypothetical protein
LCILEARGGVLTGFQARFQRERSVKPGGFAAVTLVCLVLLALLTLVQVTHIHANASDADRCPVCIMMHSAAPVTVAAAVVVLVSVRTLAPVFEVCSVTRHWHPKFFTRPPPTGC